VTGDQFKSGPAEDRLGRVVSEVRAITKQVAALPGLGPGQREPLRLAALDLVEATKELSSAVVGAAHRVPGPEDT
jgi:hypothetical protein